MIATQKSFQKREAIGTGVVVAIIAVILVVAVGGYLLVSQTPALTSTSTSQSSFSSPSTTSTSNPSSSTTTTTSSTTSTTSSQPTIVNVLMPIGVSANQSLNFLPSTITVVIGVNNTIIWTNQDVTPHTVTTLPGSTLPSGASSFDSSTLSQGQTFRLTLSIPGTYQYHCSIHPAWMKSTIIVKAAATGY